VLAHSNPMRRHLRNLTAAVQHLFDVLEIDGRHDAIWHR
jgi:hypothetical protein